MYGFMLLVALGVEPGAGVDEPRHYHEINEDLRTWLRREATAESEPARAKAIDRLCELYRELKRDPRLERSPTLTKYKNRLWGRLRRVKEDLQREFARENEDVRRQREKQLAAAKTAAGVADALALVGHSTGGPANLLTRVRGGYGGRAIPDFGPGLVDLIERTIAPEFWDVNGGPGTIVYYAPLRVLVVRATSEVHGEVRGVLGGLRAAGR